MDWVVLAQICVATVLGASLGLERELSAQPAGLRTHILVCLGSAVFTIAGVGLDGSDPARIAAQVVTGIGFLGGGAILREGSTVRGLTTAASLWVTAAIGLAVGFQWWLTAVGTTVIGLIVLWLLKYLERDLLPRRRLLMIVLSLEAAARLDQVEREALGVLVRSRVLKVSYADTGQSLMLTAQPQNGTPITVIAERLRTIPGVQGVEVGR